MITRPTVLVVEDNPTEQRLLTLLLDRFGFDATVVGNGTDALEALQDDRKDICVILMDWQMDDMDGLECTRRIREAQDKTGRFIPIIAVTARVMLGDRQKCMQAGMDDYLSKPYTVKQFEAILKHWSVQHTAMTG